MTLLLLLTIWAVAFNNACDAAAALSHGGRASRQDSFKRGTKLASQMNGLADNHSPEAASLQVSSEDRQALLSRLQGSQQDRGDLDELLAAAAKAIQDTGDLSD